MKVSASFRVSSRKARIPFIFGCDLCRDTKSIWKLVHLAGCLSLGLGSLLNVLNVTSLITKEKLPVLRNLEQKS